MNFGYVTVNGVNSNVFSECGTAVQRRMTIDGIRTV